MELLAEALAATTTDANALIELVASEYTVGWSLVDEMRALSHQARPTGQTFDRWPDVGGRT